MRQPLPPFLQHQSFLSSRQSFSQFAKPALQSNWSWSASGQPESLLLQHQAFLSSIQPSQFAKSAPQSNCVSMGQARPAFAQHHVFLSLRQALSQFP